MATRTKHTATRIGTGLVLLVAWAVHFFFIWQIPPEPLLAIRVLLIVLSVFWVLAWRGALRTR